VARQLRTEEARRVLEPRAALAAAIGILLLLLAALAYLIFGPVRTTTIDLLNRD
jgi:hypothetical protein